MDTLKELIHALVKPSGKSYKLKSDKTEVSFLSILLPRF